MKERKKKAYTNERLAAVHALLNVTCLQRSQWVVDSLLGLSALSRDMSRFLISFIMARAIVLMIQGTPFCNALRSVGGVPRVSYNITVVAGLRCALSSQRMMVQIPLNTF